MSGRKLVIGNWKMNFTVKQAVSFAGKLAAKTIPSGVEVVIAPPTIAISEIATKLQRTGMKVAAQNAYHKDEGAFTGEISMPMLRGIARYVLVGHSERRHILNESNTMVREKAAAAMRSGVIPIICIGETLTEHESRHTNQVVNEQLTAGLADLTAEEVAKSVIAYEPVWAIGTGEFASPEVVSRVEKKVRREITELYGADISKKVRFLYGGSVNADNAAAYLNTEGVDGLLVGGASLAVQTFWPIVEAAQPRGTAITVKS